jgi:hypothetical protein
MIEWDGPVPAYVVGPGQVWVLTRVSVADSLSGSQVTELVRGIEADMKRQSSFISRVDVVPHGQERPADR